MGAKHFNNFYENLIIESLNFVDHSFELYNINLDRNISVVDMPVTERKSKRVRGQFVMGTIDARAKGNILYPSKLDYDMYEELGLGGTELLFRFETPRTKMNLIGDVPYIGAPIGKVNLSSGKIYTLVDYSAPFDKQKWSSGMRGLVTIYTPFYKMV